MNDLNRALGDISSIRRQMARSTEFRGYGPATLAATGVIAVLAAAVQALLAAGSRESYLDLPEHLDLRPPSFRLPYGVQMYTRTRRMHSGMSRR